MDVFAHGRWRRRLGAVAGVLAAGAIAGCGSTAAGGKLNTPAAPHPSAYLGITMFTSTPTEAQVMTVRPGGPAQRAGIKPGDEINSVAGQSVFSPTGLLYVMNHLSPGQTVSVQMTDVAGGSLTRSVTLGRTPRRLANPSTSYAPADAL